MTDSAQDLPPRIAPGGRAEIGTLNYALARAIGRASGGDPPNVFTTLARHRRLFRAWLRFVARLMPWGTLPRRDTELVILRVAHNCGCAYEWGHHERIAQRAGLSREQVGRVTAGPSASGWTPREVALLRAADELHDERMLSDELWGQLAGPLSEPQLIELCLLIGHYEMLAMTLNSLRVAPDALVGRAGAVA
jgi:AhpD family alkylhydroperoxidase